MSDQSEQQNPFRSRRFILSVVVVGVIAVCAVIVLVSSLLEPRGNNDPGPAASAPPTSSATAKPASDPDPSVCGLDGYEAEGTVSEAPDTKWELVGTVAAPTDPESVGPGVVSADGFRTCFAHTPTGALYATANLAAAGSDTNLRKEMAEKLIVPGPGRDAAIAASTGSTSTSAVRYQIAGYKVLDYDGDSAKIDLAVNASTGQLVSFVWDLRWVDGDWKFVVTDKGQSPYAPAPLTSLGGYTPWAGA